MAATLKELFHLTLDLLHILEYYVVMDTTFDIQLAPEAENYFKPPEFKFTPKQREIDFAQLVASGGDPVWSLVKSAIVTSADAAQMKTRRLYRMAANLLKSEAIQERIEYYRILHRASMEVTSERIQQEAACIAFSDIAETQDSDGNPITNLHKLPRHVRAAIKEFYVDQNGVTRYKFYDKDKAKKLLADMSGFMDEAHRAKAPQININLSSDSPNNQQVIDITPEKETLDWLK